MIILSKTINKLDDAMDSGPLRYLWNKEVGGCQLYPLLTNSMRCTKQMFGVLLRKKKGSKSDRLQ